MQPDELHTLSLLWWVLTVPTTMPIGCIITLLPVGVQSIVIRVSVCSSVCLFVCLSVHWHISKNHTPIFSPNFLYLLRVAVARSFSDHNAMRHVLPVLRMTSCFQRMGQNQETVFSRVRQVAAPSGGRAALTWAKYAIADCFVLLLFSYGFCKPTTLPDSRR